MKNKCRKIFTKYMQSDDYMARVHVRENAEQVFHSVWKKRIQWLLFLLLCLIASFLYCCFQQTAEPPLSGNQLARQEEDTDMEILVEGQSKSANWQQKITLPVKSRQFTKKEREELTERTGKYVENRLAGDNPSLKRVSQNLVLPKSVPNTDIEIQWVADGTYLTEKGELLYEKIPQKGVDTELMAKASWKNWKDTFYYPVHLLPKEYTGEELSIREVKKVLLQAGEEDKEKKAITLPEKIGDISLRYAMEREERSFALFYLVLGFIILLPVVWRRQEKKEMADREEELLMEHSGLVNRFMLLLGAGLTVRKVVERLTDEYERERAEGGRKRYVYEEMCVMAQEMKDGVSETKALEGFGRRCRLLPYLRFSTVMTQNLKKGADGILALLENEAMEALEQRKERALQLGEKAGTKMLFPMMLMLGIVMAIIMVPAFMTM